MKKPLPFGKYYLLERINVGGMAEVFKAKSFGVEGFERIVAVKRILPSIAEDQEFITMFIDEAKVAVQLTHANIAQIFDLGKVGDSYFIAMEYVHGRDLRAIFDRSRKTETPIPVPMACYTIMKVCEGLDYAHNKKDAAGRDLNLVHRDVSPQNVLISYDGEVKVIDFGIAKAACRSAKTQAGILKGKFGYMSPEQVRGLPLDRRSDIFSVGIVLYELLTLERLFQGESDFSTLEKVRNVEIMPPSTYNPRIPDELEQIVLKALSKEVEDRYQTAMDLHDDLQSFMYTSGNFFARKDLAQYVKATFPEDDTSEGSEKQVASPQPKPQAQPQVQAAAPPRPNPPPPRGGASAPPPPPRSAPPPPPRSAPPPPPRSAPPPPPGGAQRSAPPPPPPKEIKQTLMGMPAAQAQAPTDQPQAEPVSPSGIPQDLAAGRVATPVQQSPSLDMDWDDEELATQVYDKPSDLLGFMEGVGADDGPARPPSGAGPAAAGVPGPTGPPPLNAPGGPASAPPKTPPPTMMQDGPAAPAAGPPPTMMQGGPGLGPAGPPAPSPPGPPSLTPPITAEPPTMPDAQPPSSMPAKPAKRGGVGIIIALSVVIVLLIVGGVAFFFLGGMDLISGGGTGSIGGTVHPATAQVLFNDQPIAVAGDGSFAIDDVEPGTYTLQFGADSHQPSTKTVTVAAGRPAAVAVMLTPAVATPATKTGVAIRVQPAGAKIFINDMQRPEVTPAELIELPAGQYNVRVEKTGYLPLRNEGVVVANGAVAPIEAQLQPEYVTVNLSLNPSGARCKLHQEGQSPERVASSFKVMPRRNPRIKCAANGHEPHDGPVTMPSDGALVAALTVNLERRGGGGPGPGPRPPTPPRPPPTTTDPTPPRPPVKPPPPPRGGTGYLSVNTRPWTKVYVDGRFIRNTPLMRHEVPAGSHRVTLINEGFDIRQTISVRVKSGQNTKVTRNLSQ